MKTVMIIDGGPRKNMNMAVMCEKVADGVRSVGGDDKYLHHRFSVDW